MCFINGSVNLDGRLAEENFDEKKPKKPQKLN